MFEGLKQKIAFWVLIAGYMAAAWIMLDLMFRLGFGFILEISMTKLAYILFVLGVAIFDKMRKGW